MTPAMENYKPDWREARERMIAWWQNRPVDRVPAQVLAQISPLNSKVSQPKLDVPAKYTDPETVLHNMEYHLEHTFWGGEAFPTHFVYLGPLFYLAWLGCTPHFRPDTTWFDPCLQSCEELEHIVFDRQNRWWQLYKEMVQRSLERSQGRWLVTVDAMLAFTDIVCGLLGNEKTLVAMVEQPEIIKTAIRRMLPWFVDTFTELHKIVSAKQEGGIDWLQVWAPGRTVTSQCDMSVMISPEMFREFVVPELSYTYTHVDYGFYHMDGPEQIRHLDELLKIESLQLIQWQPGARIGDENHRDPLNWLALIRRIQEAGKKVLVYCPPDRVRPLLEKVARDRILLVVYCGKDYQRAQQVLQELDKIGV